MDISAALTLASGTRAVVTGFVLAIADQSPVLCEELLESMPPQCGGAKIELVGLAPQFVGSLQESEGVRWTERVVTLKGVVRGGRFHLQE